MRVQVNPKPLPQGKINEVFPKTSLKNTTNYNIALQLYYVTKAEIKTKKVARLPENDFRRRVLVSRQNVSLIKKLQHSFAIDIKPLKKIFMTAFSSFQIKPGRV